MYSCVFFPTSIYPKPQGVPLLLNIGSNTKGYSPCSYQPASAGAGRRIAPVSSVTAPRSFSVAKSGSSCPAMNLQ